VFASVIYNTNTCIGSGIERVKPMRGFGLAALLAFGVAAWAGPPQAGLQVEVTVIDQSKLAVPVVCVPPSTTSPWRKRASNR
jgi:hypothetical protein